MRLQNKTALITGAGSGQGRAAAKLFAKEGANVVVFDVNAVGAEKTVNEIIGSGGNAQLVVGDVSHSEDVQSAVAASIEAYGGLNVLYNNAAIWSAGKIDNYVTELEEENWDTVLSINLKGAFLFCKYGIPAIIEAGGGSVINIASVAGMVGSRMRSHAYSASKGGLIALTKTMAIAYAKEGVRVNVICPGGIDTPMLQPMIPTEELYQRVAKSHPLGRMGVPEDIAKCALFLASDDSDWITGVTLPVDGGVTAC
ncbi:MAG: short-chain dehydrogenase [Moraxellaceae bacterium]|nr:MAG: short-chain dehydrogenase [Moraxellaceae bacterium]